MRFHLRGTPAMTVEQAAAEACRAMDLLLAAIT
jgi:hypothetical protein